MTALVSGQRAWRLGEDAGRDILGKVDENRPRPTRRGNVKRLVEVAREVADAGHGHVPLGAAASDALGDDRIVFLGQVVCWL